MRRDASGAPVARPGRRTPVRRPGGAPLTTSADGERASATAELLLVLPATLLLFGLGVQLALYGLASAAVDDAVAHAGAALRAEHGSPAAAEEGLRLELGAIAGRLVSHTSVAVAELPGAVDSISASGLVPSVLPGFEVRVSATSIGPVAKFRASG